MEISAPASPVSTTGAQGVQPNAPAPKPGQPAKRPGVPQGNPQGNARPPAKPAGSGDSLSDAANDALRSAQGDGQDSGLEPSDLLEDGAGDEGQGNDESKSPDLEEHEITIDGKKTKVTLAELKRGYGHMKVATQRLQEAATIRKQNEQFSGIFDSIRTNPQNFWELGTALGLDTKKMAANIVLDEMRRESLSPQERELEELRNEKNQWESERQREQRERQEREAADSEVANLHQTADSYATFFESKGVSPSLEFQERMLTYLVSSFDGPNGPLTMEQAFERAQKWEQKQKSSRWQNLTDAEIAQLPPEIRSRFRKADVAGMRRQGSGQRAPVQPTQSPIVSDKPASVSETFDSIRAQLMKGNKR